MASYAVTGWVAIEVVGALVERAILPEVAYRVGLVLFLGGLAASLVIGWYHGEKGRQRATPLEVVLLVFVALGTGWAGFHTVRQARVEASLTGAGSEGLYPLSRIGILYFADQSPDGTLAYLADALTEALIARLDDVQGLDVVSQSGSSQVRDAGLPYDSVASLFGAGTLVRGSVSERANRLRVDVELLDGESGAAISSERIERPAEDLLVLQEALAEEVSVLLRNWLGTEIRTRRARAGTDVPAAWALYQRGERARKDAELRLSAGDPQGLVDALERADSLFRQAEASDPDWAQPTIMRASLSVERARGAGGTQLGELLTRAERLADEAIAKDARSGSALEIRGTARYLRWVNGLAPGPSEAERVFREAFEDLERATELDPSLASAWFQLSILNSQDSNLVGANLAARRAYEADEFLASAPDILWTLYATSYDLENFRDALEYCNEGRRRFGDDVSFTECRLWLLATPVLTPDPDAAWALVDSVVSQTPEAVRDYKRIEGQLIVGQVLASAGMADSARAVADRARAPASVDPARELLGLEALIHLRLGDEDVALDRLGAYLTANPEHRSGWRWSRHWWWRDLQDNPEYRRLIGL